MLGIIELLASLGITYYSYYIRSTEDKRVHELRLISRKEMKILLRNMAQQRNQAINWENITITWEEPTIV